MATDIDLVVKTIRESKDTEKLGIADFRSVVSSNSSHAGQSPDHSGRLASVVTTSSRRQAKSILDMRLGKLTGLEREKLARIRRPNKSPTSDPFSVTTVS